MGYIALPRVKRISRIPLGESNFNLFQPNLPLLYPRKRQKTIYFLTFLGGIEMKNWAKMGYIVILFKVMELGSCDGISNLLSPNN